MNRKALRAERSKFASVQLLADARRLHRAGRLAEADAICRRVLASDPRYAEAHIMAGDIRAGENKLDEAVRYYERAIALDPSNVEAFYRLGNLKTFKGEHDAALAFYKSALQHDADHAATHINMGNLYRELRRLGDAAGSYLRAIEIQPDRLETHVQLCDILLLQGKFAAAAAHFEQIVAVAPGYLPAHNGLAAALLGAGDAGRALECAQRALTISDNERSRVLFVQALRTSPTIPGSDEIRRLVVRAVSEPWARPSQLVPQGIVLVSANEDIAACMARAEAAWPARLPASDLFGASGLPAMARDPVLRCLLENARISNIGLERCLTNVRHALLDAALLAETAAPPDDESPGFYCAIARQCFVNEFVYSLADGEDTRVAALRDRLACALQDDQPVPELWIIALAAYAPLYRINNIERLLDRTWSEPVTALLAQQVREPVDEAGLAKAIAPITPVANAVSVLVRQQYEENPYPRWIKTAPPGEPASIDALIHARFPFSAYRNIGHGIDVDILAAGCGTGQLLVDLARTIAGARILAVDLSLASLGYAKRKARELGIANIEFGQADIMQLGSLGRRFDIVECSGVLHHLGDPLAGWRILLSLLKPLGLMRISLYSELARGSIVAARAFISARGYEATADGIRRFRQDVMTLPVDDPVKKLAHSPDFFSTSECRDLAFHVQEHRFALPQIKAFLIENRLEFLGFDADLGVLNRYTAQFPQDPARTDLDHWHGFEQASPEVFSGMYQFWVQKRTDI